MLNTLTPAEVLRAAADELVEIGGIVDGPFLSAAIALYCEFQDPTGRLRQNTIVALAWHTGWVSLNGWLPPEEPLPAAVVAGVMRTAAAALEVKTA